MRAIVIVIDAFGIGSCPDSALYGDEGSNTFAAVERYAKLPTLQRFGLFEILPQFSRGGKIIGNYGKMQELSCGKDTTVGHLELAGCITTVPFKTFPNGFPPQLVSRLENAFGRRIIGNKAASGTAIINELGEEHLAGGCPIVYTSADSVLQIAAHKSVIGIEELYELCRKARAIMQGEYKVGRVIARPFDGERNGSFYRTAERKDFGLEPESPTMLDKCAEAGLPSVGVGKIRDIFCGNGITVHYDKHGNKECFGGTFEAMNANTDGLIFVNLVDTDMIYGHRNDVEGFARCLEETDAFLREVLKQLKGDDMLIVTADHGCDPSTLSTDHSREYVPLMIYADRLKGGINLGTLVGFDHVADTVTAWLKLKTGEKNLLPKMI